MGDTIKSYKEYIFKDGAFRKISAGSGSGSDVDVEIVEELPEHAPEDTVFYLIEDEEPEPEPSVSTLLTKITWAELKELKDKQELIPGMKYQITDYNCTTSLWLTKSANHQFDIIVTALSESQLSENASATYHTREVQVIKAATLKPGVTLENIDLMYRMRDNPGSYNPPEAKVKPIAQLTTRTNLDGIEVPCLINLDTQSGNDDYYLFYDKYTIDGTVCDRWIQCDSQGNPKLPNNNFYTLTNEVVNVEYGPGESINDGYFVTGEFKAEIPAWKLKYCLDNDTTRFEWAAEHTAIIVHDESDSEDYIYVRYPTADNTRFAWAVCNSLSVDPCGTVEFFQIPKPLGNSIDSSDLIYTDTETPSIGDILDMSGTNVTVTQTMFPHGVIYRMIDEFNNDVPYDFKNIMYYRHYISGISNEYTNPYWKISGVISLLANQAKISAPQLSVDGTTLYSTKASPYDQDHTWQNYKNCWLYTFCEYVDTSIGSDNFRIDAYDFTIGWYHNWDAEICLTSDNLIEPYYGENFTINPQRVLQTLNNITLLAYAQDSENTYLGIRNNKFTTLCNNISITGINANIMNNTFDNCYNIYFTGSEIRSCKFYDVNSINMTNINNGDLYLNNSIFSYSGGVHIYPTASSINYTTLSYKNSGTMILELDTGTDYHSSRDNQVI